MRVVIQRARRAAVRVGGATVGEIGPGLCCLVGFGQSDGPDLPASRLWRKVIDKLLGLRVFADEAGKLNLDVAAVGGGVLLVSQFTLYADCSRGRRPSFHLAAEPTLAKALFDAFAADVAASFSGPVATGEFGADMEVELVNDGPVTIILDSAEL